MGKNLKGRQLGKGLSQRQDGRYSARFVTKAGKRTEKYFDTLPEARNWLEATIRRGTFRTSSQLLARCGFRMCDRCIAVRF